MGEHTKLQFKPGVTLRQCGAEVAACLDGKTRRAHNAIQARLLQALSRCPLDLDKMKDTGLQATDETFAPLDVAALILDFDDYLEGAQ
jgi:hypothetical protein